MANLNIPQMELSEEQTAALVQIATDGYNNWKAKATAENKTAADTRMQNMHGNPEYMQVEIARLQADFDSSDADGNGRLNAAEFKVYQEKQMANSQTVGMYVEPLEGLWDREYALYNEITGGEEGFSFGEYMGLIGRQLGVVRQLKDADEAAQAQ